MFFKDSKKVKTKRNTLRNDYKDVGLNSVDIEHIITSLICSWVKWLYTENFPEWKIIPLQYINKLLGKDSKNTLTLISRKIHYHIFLASTKIY